MPVSSIANYVVQSPSPLVDHLQTRVELFVASYINKHVHFIALQI